MIEEATCKIETMTQPQQRSTKVNQLKTYFNSLRNSDSNLNSIRIDL